ncbi:hypothetical protein EV714DRAFT_214060 [Schizophyllum commune]
MRAASLFTVLGLSSFAAAHFKLQFPEPRGDFNEDAEDKFCDGYMNVDDDRERYPLTGGYVTLIAAHPSWTLGILASTADDPTSFDNFTTERPFASAEGQGTYCIPFDLDTSKYSNGQNITIQIQFNGGDGDLFQCADLTLDENYKIDVTCSNSSSTADSGDGDEDDDDSDSEDNDDDDNDGDDGDDEGTNNNGADAAAPFGFAVAAGALALLGVSTL